MPCLRRTDIALVGLLASAIPALSTPQHLSVQSLQAASSGEASQEACEATDELPLGALVSPDNQPCELRWLVDNVTGDSHVMGGYRSGSCTMPPAPPTYFKSGIFAGHQRRVVLIHVGKSAGTSLKMMLQRSPINFTHIHVQNAGEALDIAARGRGRDTPDTWIVVTRDPLARTISAFNWRHVYGGGLPCMRLPTSEGEHLMYTQCFNQTTGAANAFAESMSEENRETLCGRAALACLHEPGLGCMHLSRNFGYYLNMPLRLPRPHSYYDKDGQPMMPLEMEATQTVLSVLRGLADAETDRTRMRALLVTPPRDSDPVGHGHRPWPASRR